MNFKNLLQRYTDEGLVAVVVLKIHTQFKINTLYLLLRVQLEKGPARDYTTENPFGSYAPPRSTRAAWFVDGQAGDHDITYYYNYYNCYFCYYYFYYYHFHFFIIIIITSIIIFINDIFYHYY